jgi:hypothetical protein
MNRCLKEKTLLLVHDGDGRALSERISLNVQFVPRAIKNYGATWRHSGKYLATSSFRTLLAIGFLRRVCAGCPRSARWRWLCCW